MERDRGKVQGIGPEESEGGVIRAPGNRSGSRYQAAAVKPFEERDCTSSVSPKGN